MEHLRRNWSSSKPYRFWLTAAIIYTLFRLIIHLVYISGILAPEGEGMAFPPDLGVYIQAAERLRSGENLYPDPFGPPDPLPYLYTPTFITLFAALFRPFSAQATAFIHTLLHIIAYGALFIAWQRIFRRLSLETAEVILIQLLPIWLISTFFWTDLSILNVNVFIALFVTWLIRAVLEKQVGQAVGWVLPILLIKPQWAFPLLLPLLLGQRRFFMKVVVLSVGAYFAIAGLTLLAIGPAYGWRQYQDYFLLLSNTQHTFLWRGPENLYLGANHSITQVIVYLLGVTPGAFALATALKVLLSLPLSMVGVRQVLTPIRSKSPATADFSLNLVFALYLGVCLWVDIIWADTLFLGVIIFAWVLRAIPRVQKWTRLWLWSLFLLYSLMDFFRLAGYLLFGPRVFTSDLGVSLTLSDPGLYLPLLLIVVLTFYAIIMRQLWLYLSLPPLRSFLYWVTDKGTLPKGKTRDGLF